MACTSCRVTSPRSPTKAASLAASECSCWRLVPASSTSSSATCAAIFLPSSARRWRTINAARLPRSLSATDKSSTAPIFLAVLKKVFRLSTLPALISTRTPCQSNVSQPLAKPLSRSVTSRLEAVRSSPRKLVSRSQTTLAPPKNGSVCTASLSLAKAASASAALRAVPSMIS